MVLAPLDLAIIGIYFVAMLVIGVVVMKRASKNLDSYFLAGNSLPWWVLGVSNASAMWDITGTMWLVYNLFVYGMKGTWLPWLWPTFNQVIMMVYLAGWVRRSGVLTGAEWITTRFGAGRGGELSRVIIVVFALVSVVGFIAYDFEGMGKFSKIFLPWDLSANTYAVIVMSITAIYVLLGGMISVVITDLAQFVIMALSALALAAIAMAKVSAADIAAVVPAGWGDLSISWHLTMDWAARIPALVQNVSGDGYSLFGLFFMAMVCKGILVSIAGPAPNYDMQRVLAARTPREAGFMSGVVSAALFPRWILIAAITALGLKYLSPLFASMDPQFTVQTAQGPKIDFELVLPYVIKEFVPAGLTGVLLAGLLAAFMSTFSATVNAGGAYLVNDLYKRYLKRDGSPRHYIFASYGAQIIILIVGFSFGLMAKSVNEVTQWIVNGLWGGYTAANVLKWHWYRLNGFGYFWGMLAGIASAMILPQYFPGSGLGSLAAFPLILAISGVACVIGSLATRPEDDATLITFYRTVRPWGWWGPVCAKIKAQDPAFERNRNFGRDAVNCIVAITWQIPLWTIPVYFVFRDTRALWISVAVLLVTSWFLKKNWFDKLEKDPAAA
ncbi:MAG TPA: sodium:solute symporter family protein [Opitutus sp.]|nr:sodium:solute symporter family protein [Opitutus sp.]